MKQLSIFTKLCLLATGAALIGSSFTNPNLIEAATQEQNRTEDIKRLPGKETVVDFRGVAKKAIPAVVSIKVKGQKKGPLFGDENSLEDYFGENGDFWNFFGLPKRDSRQQLLSGQATGVIVSPEGYILTNSHVVHDMTTIAVQLHDGRELAAKLLGEDPSSDLALIKIDAKDLPYLTLGNSDDLEVGQWVAAVGNPFGLQATLTVGVVSAKSRNNLDIARYEDFIQTDASINRGNSGGPLLTLNGEIVGINTAIATNASAGYIGIGFAIPSNMAKHVMDEILSQGKVSRGFLGVSLQSIDYNLAQSFGLDKVEGALVTNIVKNSPAEKAGIQVEDIILKLNGRSIESAASLRNAIYRMKPGTKVNLTILRKEKQIDLSLTIGDFTEETVAAASSHKSQLGIEVANIPSEMKSDEQGVMITKVYPGSVANFAGLKKGAIILGINHQKIENVEQFNNALKNSSADKPILLQVKQGNAYLFVSLRSE
ncbi:DegQ family serine endoprotease [Candidatus Protochlamydia amoebophila]|uniref:Periplasmic serine endoprotease DegP-like n=2 Tax=Candidatus Protochlamydia amoebophila TaxID=362787 RepID=Q6MBN4_PARUW|nr:DegQ family serine endoprotease [Candidatus Protochlamydia amoebophila]KIC71234.1 putative periplasmic serine endoprotease DegP-like [Candidatus Protochlamydia amoebophila]CAF24015.1 unnamed protein product [Candidatus Protochlamydia amoebophila UWE25]